MTHAYPPFVIAMCDGTRLSQKDDIIPLNIEEDFNGHDILTFKCPICDSNHKSRVFKDSIPAKE